MPAVVTTMQKTKHNSIVMNRLNLEDEPAQKPRDNGPTSLTSYGFRPIFRVLNPRATGFNISAILTFFSDS